MAIAYRGGATDDNGNSNGDNALAPGNGGAQEDDLVLCTLFSDGNSRTLIHPEDFSVIGVFSISTTSGRDMTTEVSYKFAGPSETSTYNCSVTGADAFVSVGINVFSGVDLSTPFDITPAATHEDNGTNDATPDAPDIDTSSGNDGDMIVTFHFGSHDDITDASAPAGFTIGTEIVGSIKDHRQQVVAYKLQATKGNEVIGSWLHDASPAATMEWHVGTVALRAAVAAGDPATILPFLQHMHG